MQVTGGTTTGIDVTHGPITDNPLAVRVNGSDAYGNVPVNAYANDGTARVAGLTGWCGGTTSGTVQRGDNPDTPDFILDAFNFDCGPFIESLKLAPGCTISADMKTQPADVGLADTIEGVATVANQCLMATGYQSGCTYRVQGNISVKFKETPTIADGTRYQEVVLSGTGLSTSNASVFCAGWIPNGSAITLDDVTLNLKVTSGSIVYPGTPPTGAIDFHS